MSIQTAALTASYGMCLELVKNKKSFSDGEVVKKCAIIMAKAYGESSL